MSMFQPITLSWAGTEYVIAPNRVMGAIAAIEEVITLVELYQAIARNKVPLSKLAMAYGVVLRYAGAKVEDGEVYKGMFQNGMKVNQAFITHSVITLLAMMQPPADMIEENASSGNPVPAAAKSSKKRTRQRSETTGG